MALMDLDNVHGHNNVYKATMFPQNVGLGVTRQVMIDSLENYLASFMMMSITYSDTALDLI
jgi:beta-glucosidase-like glycosyl hydrolase